MSLVGNPRPESRTRSAAVAAFTSAGLPVVASSTYTGLLKVLLDRLPSRALAGLVAVAAPGRALLESQVDRLESVLAEWAALIVSAVQGALTAEVAR